MKIYAPSVKSVSEVNDSLDTQKRFDFIQELLNQVVPRKYEITNRSGQSATFEMLDEDGMYGTDTQTSIELLRSSFDWVGWDTSEVMKRLMDTYINNFGNDWLVKVIDRDLLVGRVYASTPDIRDTNIHRDGLLELYENFVMPFIDKMIKEAERYVEDTTRWVHRPTDVGEPELIGTGDTIYNDTENGILYLNTGVAYSNGSIDRIDQWREKIMSNLDPGIDPPGDYNRDNGPGGIGVDDDNDSGIDINDPQIMAADYDGDGIPLYGNNHLLESTLSAVGGDDDPDDITLCRSDDDEDGEIDENTPPDDTLYPVNHWYQYGFGHQPGLYSSEETLWARQNVGRYCPWDWAGIDCRGFVQRCIKIAGDRVGVVPDEIVPDLDDNPNYDIGAGQFTGQDLNEIGETDNQGNAYFIHLNRRKWLDKGDIILSPNHVVIIYKVPQRPLDNITFRDILIINAYGITPKDLDGDDIGEFTRKVIVFPLTYWANWDLGTPDIEYPIDESDNNHIAVGRIRLWK